MKRKLPTNYLIAGVTLLSASCTNPPSSENESAPTLPNIIYILADDLGYGDLGAYGQIMIETPHLDALAANGIRFTRHYTGSPVCAPARSVLLTGRHTGKAQIRGNDEWRERGEVWDYRAMLADSTLEGQRPMESGTATIGTMLQSAGYTTALIGKWGLGAPHTESVPNTMGFDYFYGYNCQRQAHTLYPLHLWENDKRVLLLNDTIAPNTRLAPNANPYLEDSYAPFNLSDYAPDRMFAALQNFVDQNSDRPFFLCWATPIPHAPLQAPKRWVDYYTEKFGPEEPYQGEAGYFPQRTPRAAYAAMISYLDEQVGSLVSQLKAAGIYEHTLIIFTSDNGPTFNGGTDSPWFKSAGPFNSEQGYGKGYLHEGGIRVPMIASWPGRIKPGTLSNHPSVFYDVMPTLAEIANIDHAPETDGISFLPELLGLPQKEHPFIYWEFPEYGGQLAIRIGPMKGLLKNVHNGNRAWQVFNLENDSTETHNIAADHPEFLQRIQLILKQEHSTSSNRRWQFEMLDM